MTFSLRFIIFDGDFYHAFLIGQTQLILHPINRLAAF
jgi:hypothetical protein